MFHFVNMNLDEKAKHSDQSSKSSYGEACFDIMIGLTNCLRPVDIQLDGTQKQSSQPVSSSGLQQLYNEWLGYIESRTRYADLTDKEIDDISARFKLSPEVVRQALKYLRDEDNVKQSHISDQEYQALCMSKTKDELIIRSQNLRKRNRILLKNAVENAFKTPNKENLFPRIQWTPVWQASHLCYEEVLQIIATELEKSKKDGDSYAFSADSEETYGVSDIRKTIAGVKSAVTKGQTGKSNDPHSIRRQSQKGNNLTNPTRDNMVPNIIIEQSQVGKNTKADYQQPNFQVRGTKLGGQRTKGKTDHLSETSKQDMSLAGNAGKMDYLNYSQKIRADSGFSSVGSNVFRCDGCDLNYLTEAGLRAHVDKHHSKKNEVHQAEEPSFQGIPFLENSVFSKRFNDRMKNDARELNAQLRVDADAVSVNNRSVKSDNISQAAKNNVTSFTLISHDDATGITTETKSQTTKSPSGTMLTNQTKSTSYKGAPRTSIASGTLDQIAEMKDGFSERNDRNTQDTGRKLQENMENDKKEYKKREYGSSGQPIPKDLDENNLAGKNPQSAHINGKSQAGKPTQRGQDAGHSVDGPTHRASDSSGPTKSGLIDKYNRDSITNKVAMQGSSEDQFITVPPGVKGVKLNKSMYPECSYDERNSAFWNENKTALDMPMGIIQIKQIKEKKGLDLSIDFFNSISVALRVKGYSAPSGEELRDDVILYMESNGKALEFAKYYISYPQYFEFLAAVNQGMKAPSRTVINATGQYIHMEIVYYSHCSEVISEESYNTKSLAKKMKGKIFLHEPLGQIVLVEVEDIRDCNLPPWKAFSPDVQYEVRIKDKTMDTLRRLGLEAIYKLYPECIFSHPDNEIVDNYLKLEGDAVVVCVFPDSCCLFHAVSAALRYKFASFIHLGWAECPPGYHLRMQLAHFMKSKVLRNQPQSYYTLDLSQLENDKEMIATYLERVECLENGSLWPCDFELDAICDFLRINITMFKLTETGISKTIHKYGGTEASKANTDISIANVFNERCFVLFYPGK